MSSDNLNSLGKLDQLKKTSADLKSDLKQAKFGIDEHCSYLRNKVDLKVENLIHQLNQVRECIFADIKNFEDEYIHHFENQSPSETVKLTEFINGLEQFST
jgi:hypothetical protein